MYSTLVILMADSTVNGAAKRADDDISKTSEDTRLGMIMAELSNEDEAGPMSDESPLDDTKGTADDSSTKGCELWLWDSSARAELMLSANTAEDGCSSKPVEDSKNDESGDDSKARELDIGM